MLKLWLNNWIIALILTHSVFAHANHTAIEISLEARESEINKIATDMEEIMLLQFLKQMHESQNFENDLDNTLAMRMHKDLLVMQYAKLMAKSHSIGIARHVSDKVKKVDSKYQQLLREKTHE